MSRSSILSEMFKGLIDDLHLTPEEQEKLVEGWQKDLEPRIKKLIKDYLKTSYTDEESHPSQLA